MRAAIICFTGRGASMTCKIKSILEEQGAEVKAWCKKKGFQETEEIASLNGSIRQWTEREFSRNDALIFVGATGIAVRSIAPFLKSKVTDPAVITVDEQGTFVISLVSGHIGGANELCERIADYIGGTPVITTATDRNQKFAVDVFARKNKLWISDMKMAKWISAQLLDDRRVGFHSDFPVEGEVPEELSIYRGASEEVSAGSPACNGSEYGIAISIYRDRKPYPETLHLVPQIAVLGVGCRKGKSAEEIEALVLDILQREGISLHAVEKVCSIDVKAQEEGILHFCGKYNLPFETYTARQLKAVNGDFSASAFVSEQVGVDNVCERSAVAGSDGGALLVKKTAINGVTAALALRKWRVQFE